MDPENFNSKELQELKSEFNDLKETLDKQRIVNKEILEHIQKQKISFIGKDLKSRMSTDIITIPMIFVICNTVRWPIMFAVAVSVWAILDLISVLWMKKKFNTSTLLESDVLTVAKSIKEYKKYYHLSVAGHSQHWLLEYMSQSAYILKDLKAANFRSFWPYSFLPISLEY